jgi:preprotein translocase subunit YajC
MFPFFLIFGIFYVLLFLPQQRRQKQQREMLANLKNGDRVITTGGIRGTIVGLKEDYIHLRVPPQDIRLEVSRAAVSGLVSVEEKKSG